MEPWTVDGKGYSILTGVYIHAEASGIIRNRLENQIAGLMLDTTCDVMRLYVMARPVAISRNAALPLGFTFGATETVELDEQFSDLFAERQIKLSEFLFEADQGSALVSLFKKHGNLH
jgi:hypothetical protein